MTIAVAIWQPIAAAGADPGFEGLRFPEGERVRRCQPSRFARPQTHQGERLRQPGLDLTVGS